MASTLPLLDLLFAVSVIAIIVLSPVRTNGLGEEISYSSDEVRLTMELLRRMERLGTLARPVRNSSTLMKVEFALSLIQILGFDMQNQVLTTLVWKRYLWNAEILTWNPDDYGGLRTVHFRPEMVWTPDIVLYNNVGDEDDEKHKHKLIVAHDGYIKWVPKVIYRSACMVDTANFPFDRQTCVMPFGPWTQNTNSVMMYLPNAYSFDVTEYMQNTEWELENTSVCEDLKIYQCCPGEPFQHFIFTMNLKRHHGFYSRVILIPILLLSMLVIVIFWIPPTRPDRIGLGVFPPTVLVFLLMTGMSLFTSFMLLLLLVANSCPPNPVSRIGTFCIINITVVTTATVMSVIIINLSKRKRPLPWIVQTVFIRGIGLILLGKHCREAPNTMNTSPTASPRYNADVVYSAPAEELPLEDHSSVQTARAMDHNHDWQTLAKVLDRIFFLFHVVFLLVCIMLIFPRPDLYLAHYF